MRRPRKRSRSSVASSAQWTSSTTTSVGAGRHQLGEEGAEDLLARRTLAQQRVHLAAQRAGDVDERAERARRRERVAGADRGHVRALARPPAPQRWTSAVLPTAGLGRRQDEAAAPGGRLAQQAGELVDEGLALKQLHHRRRLASPCAVGRPPASRSLPRDGPRFTPIQPVGGRRLKSRLVGLTATQPAGAGCGQATTWFLCKQLGSGWPEPASAGSYENCRAEQQSLLKRTIFIPFSARRGVAGGRRAAAAPCPYVATPRPWPHASGSKRA